MPDEQHNLKEKIFAEIHSGGISMRPKVYFTLKIVALGLLTLAILIVSIFILNFILFSLRLNEHESLLGFGFQGFVGFLWFFPWGLLLIDVLLVMALQSLLRQFQVGYRIPVLYLFSGLLIATIVTGFALDRGTPLNDDLFDQAEHHNLPRPFREVYMGARHMPLPGSGVCLCTVLSIKGNTLTVQDVRNGTSTLTIVLPNNSPYATTTMLKAGDLIFVAGQEADGVIHAYGLRTNPPQNHFYLQTQ